MRASKRFSVAMVATTVLLVHAADAGRTPEQKCQKGRYFAAAKYAQCHHKATGAFNSGSDFTKFVAATAKCQAKYDATWAKLQKRASGSGATCDDERYEDNADGTLTDRLTGLQWEQKTDEGSVHDRDNSYSWSAGGAGGSAADGTIYTSLLAAANGLSGGTCFAGNCDWRLPTLAELQTIPPALILGTVDEGDDFYWSSMHHGVTNAMGLRVQLNQARSRTTVNSSFGCMVRRGSERDSDSAPTPIATPGA